MKYLICGGRDFDDSTMMFRLLSGLGIPRPGVTVIHGGARGADTFAGEYARYYGLEEEVYKAEWKKYGKSAGYLRNKRMLDEGKPDLVIAFPGGKGTGMMVDLAKKAGIMVIEVGAKGSYQIAEPSDKMFKTEMYEKMYVDKMTELRGFATPGQRHGILRDLLREEQAWLDSMSSEYDEIMQAQDFAENQ